MYVIVVFCWRSYHVPCYHVHVPLPLPLSFPFPSSFLAARYTLIVTSDTLYSEQSMLALLHILKTCLAKNGHALVAAKRYYFGIGREQCATTYNISRDGMGWAVQPADMYMCMCMCDVMCM